MIAFEANLGRIHSRICGQLARGHPKTKIFCHDKSKKCSLCFLTFTPPSLCQMLFLTSAASGSGLERCEGAGTRMKRTYVWSSGHLALGVLYIAGAHLLALVLMGTSWCIHQNSAQGTSDYRFLPLC